MGQPGMARTDPQGRGRRRRGLCERRGEMNTALRIQEQRLKGLKDLEDQVRARNNGDGAKNGKSHPSVTNPIAPCVTVKNTLCNNSTPANNVTQDIQGNTGIQDIQGDSGLS